MKGLFHFVLLVTEPWHFSPYFQEYEYFEAVYSNSEVLNLIFQDPLSCTLTSEYSLLMAFSKIILYIFRVLQNSV